MLAPAAAGEGGAEDAPLPSLGVQCKLLTLSRIVALHPRHLPPETFGTLVYKLLRLYARAGANANTLRAKW